MISDIIINPDIQSIHEKTVLVAHSGKADVDPSPDKAVMDRKAALERTMGDEKFLSDLLQEFIGYLPNIKDKIVDAILHENASTLAKEAKLLAGAAGNLGAVGLSDAAFDLEMASRKTPPEVHRIYRRLELELNSFVEHVQLA